jgi:hypothetical protein
MEKTFNLGDKVIMKKPHACGTNEWTITRMGVDIKIKCVNCGREVMLDRLEFTKKLKKVIGGNNEKKDN